MICMLLYLAGLEPSAVVRRAAVTGPMHPSARDRVWHSGRENPRTFASRRITRPRDKFRKDRSDPERKFDLTRSGAGTGHLPTAYSMTSSARASSDGGIVKPSAAAVLRLMTRSVLIGGSTGRSPGLAPLRILST